MATDDDLRNRLRGEPGATPEDTRSELLSDLETRGLRAAPGATPEDTRSELLERQKEARKADEADAMRDEAIAIARAWTEEQAKQRAARDLADHGQLVAVGPRGDGDAYYLRSDMALRARESDFYNEALKSADAALHARVLDVDKENVSVDVAARLAAANDRFTVEDVPEIRPKGESLDPAALEQLAAARQRDNAAARQAMGLGAEKAVDDGLKAQLEDDVRRRKAREQELAGQGLNAVDVKRSGTELQQGEFIMPKRIANTYTELDGKFFTKDTNRVAFEVTEVKIATHSTDKRLIEDMMAVAKAKGWQDIKLSGSQEFRREAWLQAESQGIATKGYTPKQSDLAALETLRQERSTNMITPVQERKTSADKAVQAPRHNLNTNQATMHVEASKFVAKNLEELQKKPGMAGRSVEDLSKLAYWRGIVVEENKAQPVTVKDEALARFDKLAADPQFLKRLDAENAPTIQDKTTERAQRRDTPEHSL